MLTERHELDPDGDVTLVLTRFIPVPPTSSKAATMGSANGSTTASVQTDDKTRLTKDGALVGDSDELEVTVDVEVLVSSKHLSLASPVFKAMLRGSFRESVKLANTKEVEVRLPDDDADIMLLMLKVIHHHWRSASRSIDFVTIKNVALMVDKYAVKETAAAGFYIWLNVLEPPEPKSFDSTVAAWLFIYWTAIRPLGFRRLTRLAERESRGRLMQEGEEQFPLPDAICGQCFSPFGSRVDVNFAEDAIEENRQKALQAIFQLFQTLLDDYGNGTTRQCRERVMGCDAMVLGSLQLELKSKKLFPLPKAPFVGISVLQTSTNLRSLEYMTPDHFSQGSSHRHRICGVKNKILNHLDQITGLLGGLDLASFEAKQVNRN
ncbi:MAG: hypothetical protein M1823_006025 [Watsoniomyces obsoletus]|nr:MAG: hypothetical protein M1823_006025 [Watsoniomyces obsoletus]